MSSTEERYGRAIRSSHLKHAEAPGDVDTLTAAGATWIDESIGMRFLRLRDEFDRVKRSTQAAGEANRRNLAEAQAVADAVKVGPTLAPRLRDDAAREALTARLLILMELRSLYPAKQALGGYAWNVVTRRGLALDVAEVEAIVGKVIDAWLDRLCHKCAGRGKSGGYDGPELICRTCKGTRNRRFGVFSPRAEGQVFAENLFDRLDAWTQRAASRMRRALR